MRALLKSCSRSANKSGDKTPPCCVPDDCEKNFSVAYLSTTAADVFEKMCAIAFISCGGNL